MSKELTWKKAIDKVLAASSEPLHYKEITEQIISDGLRTSLGATPAATVNAQISASIKKLGEEAPYVRVAKGTFALNQKAGPKMPTKKPGVVKPEPEEEEQYAIVSSFGMFWRREAIEWMATPKLLGMQQIGATPVDFTKQIGIYLLYDGREVIYVGRTTDRPLGRRLYEHTIDRMSARWDRFSWFGLLPVSDSGALGKLSATFDATKMIPALEAILIEALEPRQNRKRGDDLAAVEYLQKEDPSIKKKMVKDTLETALSKL
ncbi:HTH domain-containing protein [Haloferula sp. A504]|uniref:HTH domain-containing protein n=1 Tax=Haloferula sp. A504 TaxID=3373601 RepID=UPI0031C9BFBE|nr:HTH domain-containing protein [Verrucomicrobiaceae bacterium E54]